MSELGRIMVVAGLIVAVVGLGLWGLGRAGCRGWPGDVHYVGERVQFHFPIVTCLALSAILTAVLWLWNRMQHR